MPHAVPRIPGLGGLKRVASVRGVNRPVEVSSAMVTRCSGLPKGCRLGDSEVSQSWSPTPDHFQSSAMQTSASSPAIGLIAMTADSAGSVATTSSPVSFVKSMVAPLSIVHPATPARIKLTNNAARRCVAPARCSIAHGDSTRSQALSGRCVRRRSHHRSGRGLRPAAGRMGVTDDRGRRGLWSLDRPSRWGPR